MRAAVRVFLSSMAMVMGPTAAGYRSDGCGLLGNALEVHVAHQPVAAPAPKRRALG